MTTTTMVTLDEVLRAAGNRKAALAPETSGYFALAIGDATARLPLGIDDRAVALTTEGAVLVPRKGNLVAPADAARTLRDALARLLAVSAGSMPGLAAAARPRAEADVDGVVASIEGALIPVNRSAARRALARLARETLRAKEAGKLGAVRAVAPVADSPPSVATVPISAAVAKVAPEPTPPPTVYLTGMGIEVLIETSKTPEPYPMTEVAIEADHQTNIVSAEADPVVELAPMSASSMDALDDVLDVLDADEIAEDDESIPPPPSRETTPTLLGVGDVGVYITAALSPSPADVDPDGEEPPADLTEPSSFATESIEPPRVLTLSGVAPSVAELEHLQSSESIEPPRVLTLSGVAPSVAELEHLQSSESIEPPRVITLSGVAPDVEELDYLESVAADLSNVPTATPPASFGFDDEDDDTDDADDEAITNAVPLVRVSEAEAPYREPAIAIAPYPTAPLPLRRDPEMARQKNFELSPTTASNVDDLLSRFNVAGVRDEHRVAQSLKTFVGIDLTAAPPIIWESPRPRAIADVAPPSSNGWETSPPPPAVRSSRAARFGFAISAAILAIGLVGTSMVWRFRPDLFGGWPTRATPNKLAPPATPAREPHAGFDP